MQDFQEISILENLEQRRSEVSLLHTRNIVMTSLIVMNVRYPHLHFFGWPLIWFFTFRTADKRYRGATTIPFAATKELCGKEELGLRLSFTGQNLKNQDPFIMGKCFERKTS